MKNAWKSHWLHLADCCSKWTNKRRATTAASQQRNGTAKKERKQTELINNSFLFCFTPDFCRFSLLTRFRLLDDDIKIVFFLFFAPQILLWMLSHTHTQMHSNVRKVLILHSFFSSARSFFFIHNRASTTYAVRQPNSHLLCCIRSFDIVYMEPTKKYKKWSTSSNGLVVARA